MSPVHAFCLSRGRGAEIGLTGLPGRSFPDARRGEPLAREAIERCGARTLLVLDARAADFFFFGVLKRFSRRGADGWSPFVFCACSAPLPANIMRATNSNRSKTLKFRWEAGCKKRFDRRAFKKWRQKTG